MPSRSPAERAGFEETMLSLDVSGFSDPDRAHAMFLRKTLGAIGAGNLVTEAARAWIEAAGAEAAPLENARPFKVTVS
ncbi:hypothetical protein DKP78_23170, partial [Enterococcus faecium]